MEPLICQKVLLQLAGYPTDDIKLVGDTQFQLSQSVDPVIRPVAERFLEFGQHYLNVKLHVQRFSTHKAGLVHHALSSALNSMLDDYLLFLTQLESRLVHDSSVHGLGTLWTLSQPTFLRLRLLSQLVSAISDNKAYGGQVLDILYSFCCKHSGDVKAKHIFNHLLNKASKPYLKILVDWLNTGSLQDPYDEFFILKRASKLPTDALVEWWWSTGFQIRPSETSSVPSFLANTAEKILSTGKYWHVLLACGKSVGQTETIVDFDISNVFRLNSLVNSAHSLANKAVLSSLFNEYDLLPKLRAMKHYFFLSQADFLQEFLDNSLHLLRLPSSQLSAVKLQSILELAIKTSSTLSLSAVHNAYVPVKKDQQVLDDSIKIQLSKYAFVDMLVRIISGSDLNEIDTVDSPSMSRMTGLYTMALDVDIPFPLSIIISRKSITKYQLIFRQLFILKAVETMLKSAWIDHQISARLFTNWKPPSDTQASLQDQIRLEKFLRMAWMLRARMCSLVQGLLAFVCDRLESQYHLFSEWLLKLRCSTLSDETTASLESVDELILKHDHYLDACLKECLITNKKLVIIQHQLFSTCTSFAQQTERFLKSYMMDPSIVFTMTTGVETSKSPLDVYSHVVQKCHTQFEDTMKSFKLSLDLLSEAEGEAWVQEILIRIGLIDFK